MEAGQKKQRDDALGQVEDWQEPYFQTVTEALGMTKPRPNVTYWIDVENILTNAFNDIVTGGAPVFSVAGADTNVAAVVVISSCALASAHLS